MGSNTKQKSIYVKHVFNEVGPIANIDNENYNEFLFINTF